MQELLHPINWCHRGQGTFSEIHIFYVKAFHKPAPGSIIEKHQQQVSAACASGSPTGRTSGWFASSCKSLLVTSIVSSLVHFTFRVISTSKKSASPASSNTPCQQGQQASRQVLAATAQLTAAACTSDQVMQWVWHSITVPMQICCAEGEGTAPCTVKS